MRLIKYLSYSNVDEEINKFRAMTISLTKPTGETFKILNHIYENYNIDKVEPILENLNKELRKFYTGTFIYDLCFESDKKIADITENKRKTEPLTLALFEANDKLSRIKSSLETMLKTNMNIK
jgi:hypothetical protein